MNARERRKTRRQAERLAPVLDDVGETGETVETYERVEWRPHPCPRCGMAELKRLAGTDVLLCYICDR